jgi:hypothetical protein
MYEASISGIPIYKVEVERETESSVWVNGRKRAKSNIYGCLCNTIQEAKEWCLNDIDRKIEKQENGLNYLKDEKAKLVEKLNNINL